MKNKAIFLDRDGTINVEKDYLFKIEDFEFLPGVIDAMQLLLENNYLLIIITNQSGIARGYYSEEDFLHLNEWMINELKSKNVKISKVYYCPHYPKSLIEKYSVVCSCRKPKLGLFKRAVDEFDIDLQNSFAVGDKIRDCSICSNGICRGYLIGKNEKEEIIKAVKAGQYKGVKYACDLKEAAEDISEKTI